MDFSETVPYFCTVTVRRLLLLGPKYLFVPIFTRILCPVLPKVSPRLQRPEVQLGSCSHGALFWARRVFLKCLLQILIFLQMYWKQVWFDAMFASYWFQCDVYQLTPVHICAVHININQCRNRLPPCSNNDSEAQKTRNKVENNTKMILTKNTLHRLHQSSWRCILYFSGKSPPCYVALLSWLFKHLHLYLWPKIGIKY